MEKYLNAYLKDSKRVGSSQHSIVGRSKDIKYFFKWCPVDDIEEIDKTVIEEFIDYQIDKGVSSSTINLRIRILKGFFKWLVHEEILLNSPMIRIKPLKEEKKVITPFSKKDVLSMIEYYSRRSFVDVRNKTIIVTFAETGIRNSELRHIKVSDIHENYIVIHGKGNKQRLVPISTVLSKQLLRYEHMRRKQKHSNCEYLFFNVKSGTQMSHDTPLRIVRIASKDVLNTNVTVHNLRRFYAVSMLDNVDIFTLSKLLGHSDIGTTQRYVQGTEQSKILERGMNSPLSSLN